MTSGDSPWCEHGTVRVHGIVNWIGFSLERRGQCGCPGDINSLGLMVSKKFDASAYVVHALKDQREWVAAKADFFAEDAAELKDRLSESSFDALLWASMALSGLGNYYGARGELRVVDGQASGWDDVGRALNYAYWSARIGFHITANTQFLRSGGPRGLSADDLTPISNLLCAALVAQSETVHKTLDDAVWLLAQDQPENYSVFVAPRSFEPFVFWLAKSMKDGTLENVGADVPGVYGGIVAAWDDAPRLAEALREACDYHCTHMSYSKKKAKASWDLEFDGAPFDLIPFDIMAVRAVRKRLGLPTPSIEHPLLSSPLVDPEKINFVDDPVTLRVAEIAADIFGK